MYTRSKREWILSPFTSTECLLVRSNCLYHTCVLRNRSLTSCNNCTIDSGFNA